MLELLYYQGKQFCQYIVIPPALEKLTAYSIIYIGACYLDLFIWIPQCLKYTQTLNIEISLRNVKYVQVHTKEIQRVLLASVSPLVKSKTNALLK